MADNNKGDGPSLSTESLKKALQIAKIGIGELTLSTNKVVWSDDVYGLLGVCRDVLGDNYDAFFTMVHPEDREVAKRLRSETLKHKRPYKLDYRVIRSDGVQRIFHTEAQIIFDEKGDPLRIIGTIQDITDNKETEASLRRSEARLNRSQQLAKLGSWERNLLTNETYWSEELCKMLGVSYHEFKPSYEYFLSMVHPEDRGMVRTAVSETIYSGKPYSMDFRIRLPDGRCYMAHAEGDVSRDPDGNPVGITGTMQDVTERMKAEETLFAFEAGLRKSESRYRMLLEQLPENIWIYQARLDEVASTIYVSHHISMMGYSQEEWTKGRDMWSKRIHPDDRWRVLAEFSKGIESGMPFSIEYRMLTRDGKVLWFNDDVAVVKNETGVPQFFQGVMTNITERKRNEAEWLLLHSIAREIAESRDFKPSFSAVLSSVCEGTGWTYGEVWVPDESGEALRYFTSYCCSCGDCGKIVKKNETLAFKLGVGLPGRVWKSRRPEWVRDVSVNGYVFLRAFEAKGLNFRSALGFPVVADEKVLAVLVFMSHEELEENKNVTEFITAISYQIGSAMKRRLAEDALFRKNDELKDLNEELHFLINEVTSIEERERRRFAEILHENICQNLVSIKMGADKFMKACSEEKPQYREHIKNVARLLDETIQSTRSVTAMLYPVPLEDVTLSEAIRWHINAVVDPNKIRVSMDIENTAGFLPTAKKEVMFRITRECIQNTLKHSGATALSVLCRKSGGRLRVEIKDNGTGFSYKDIKTKKGRGFGIMLMKEWAKSINAELRIGSEPGEGTEVIIDAALD